ncbi:hypothetical protein PN456_21805 [Nodularia spumigena CS-586/05]|uniref:Uncharacterized protein n=1 Tax=Nodularia spumigena CENA596 TaxID=1819295 RepID=A0A166I914_NODSP|nr:hypothetical protein [Nodularia spumigena]KZL48084.1 hypothetical protein A2T98_19390 [Nodularia spumigena CENA596]MDB9342218.1 hypothetical protein [Nodularia spumigena CS-588/06]MDB9371541.1 hypothetical protein [Nodularia spumigena CS-586/05]
MKSNHISAERQLQESLWRELTEEETEKVQGGFGFLLFDRNRFRNLLFNLLSQITARVREVGVQNMITPGNESFSVERTKTIIVENGETIFSEQTEEITVG